MLLFSKHTKEGSEVNRLRCLLQEFFGQGGQDGFHRRISFFGRNIKLIR